MAKFDVKKMAAGLKLSSEKSGEGSEAEPKETDEGSPGRKLCEAIEAKNYAAIEEAVRAIAGG